MLGEVGEKSRVVALYQEPFVIFTDLRVMNICIVEHIDSCDEDRGNPECHGRHDHGLKKIEYDCKNVALKCERCITPHNFAQIVFGEQ